MDGPTEKLILAVQSDLKTLSLETKKRHGWVKDACEEAIAKIRGAGTAPSALPYVTQEALYPVLQGCDTRDPKIVKVCLHSVQKLITGGHVDVKGARSIVETAVGLLEAGLEEIKVLQTVTLLLTTNAVVRGALLAQALVLCFRLYASKDTMTSHAAGATVRQLVSLVFERLESNGQEGKDDAYGLLTDLILLVNGEEAVWLTGVRDLPRPFGLELLESILARFPSVFQKYDDFGVVLKERVCAMVIKLFSPNAKGKGGSGEWAVSVRLLRLVDILCVSYFGLLVTECEIFLSLLVRLLDPDKPTWVRCLALEVLHRLITAPPALANFCRAYDLKPHATNVCRDILNALGAYVQSVFATAPPDPTTSTASPSPPAFYFRGNIVPLVTLFHPSTPKSTLLELTEKTEPPAFATSESYGVAISFACLSDFVLSLVHIDAHIDDRDVLRTLLTSTWPGLLAALNLLLEASIDDTITESICDRLVDVATLSGKVGVTQAREATVLSLCVATLPPHYGYAVLKGTVGHGEAPHPISYSEMDNAKQQVVVVGTSVVPSLALPTSLQGTPVMLTRKNLLVTGSVLRLSLEGGSLLLTSWLTVLTTLQHLCWVTGIVAKSSADFIASHVARLGIDSRAQLTSSVHSNSWGESSGYSGGSSSSSLPSSTSPISAGLSDLSINAKSGKKNGGAPSSAGGVMAVVVDFVSCLGAGVVRLIETSVSLDDVSLHHVINALTTLSQEAMEIAYSNREPSLFAVAKLLEVGLVNLDRVEMYWRPLTSHLLEVCRHPHMRMREWGSEAVTFLVRSALLHSDSEDERLVSLLLSPLAELSSIPHNDVRAKELTALSQILHVKGDRLRGSWPLALSIVGDVHEGHGEGLVRAAFQCLQLVVTDYLPVLPVGSLPAAIATVGKFGAQKAELNVALSAVGLTWNIADFLFQNKTRLADGLSELPPPLPPLNDVPPFDRLWLAIFQRLGELCVDERPAVRKSSGQTLFSTIGAHSGVLGERSYEAVLWQVLFPLLEAVDTAWKNARSEKVDGGSGSLLIHHSRNTEHKQWAETHVLVLSGIARIFSSKRSSLLSLPSFPRAWTLLLNFIAGGATSANDEVSFAALKSFQEALTPPFSNSMMTPELWRSTWNVYLDIGAKAVTSAVEGSRGPTQAYLTAYAHLFVALFPALQSSLSPSDLAALNKVFARSLVIPLTAEGASSSLLFSSDSSMSPLQDAVYFAYNTLIQEAERIRDLRKLFPGVILQLINFGAYAVRNVTAAKGIPLEGVVPNCMDFGIRCLREAVRVLADVAKDGEMKGVQEELFSAAVRAFRPIVACRFENAEGAWRQTAGEFFEAVGLMVTTRPQDESFWKELGAAAEELLFWSGDGRTSTGAKGWKDDAVDVRAVGMLRDLVFSQTTLPPSFLVAVVKIFHRGSSINEYDGINVSEREEFVRACFSSLLEFVLRGPASVAELVETVEGKRVAVLALLERFQAILVAYKEYVGHNSHIPIARHRLAEMTFVLRAIASLIENLKGADPTRVTGGTWEYIVELYPDLVAIVGLPGVDAAISTALRDALLAYRDLLSPPPKR